MQQSGNPGLGNYKIWFYVYLFVYKMCFPIQPMISVLIADDHPIVSYGIKLLLKQVTAECEVDTVEDGEAVYNHIKQKKYDLLILDMNMPKSEGVEMVAQLLIMQPLLKILILTVNSELFFAQRYLRAGAFGYVEKNQPDNELVEALRQVIFGKRYYSAQLMKHLSDVYIEGVPPNPFDRLSGREFEVALLLMKGKGINEIADKLSLHTSTASTYKTRIQEKLGVGNLYELMNLGKHYHIFQDLID